MTEELGWDKILVTALVASFFTACITEPVKVAIHGWIRRRHLRRAIYHEMSANFDAIHGQVVMAQQDKSMILGIGTRFSRGFRRLAYDMALQEPLLFYQLGHDEIYWIDLLYGDWQHVIDRSPEDDLGSAQFAMHSVLNLMKNRHISKRLMFSVSKKWIRDYFRQQLPQQPYIGTGYASFMELKVWRRVDALRFRYWLTRYGPRR